MQLTSSTQEGLGRCAARSCCSNWVLQTSNVLYEVRYECGRCAALEAGHTLKPNTQIKPESPVSTPGARCFGLQVQLHSRLAIHRLS